MIRGVAVWVAAVSASVALHGPARADDGDGPRAHRIHVTGHATVEAPPDYAAVSVGVTSRAPATASAIDATSTAAAKIIGAAKAAAIAPADIQTGYVSLQPAYRNVTGPNGQTEQRPDGYQAQNSVVIRVRDLGRLGEVLRTVVDSGANRISGVDFMLADPRALELKAIETAVKNARRQAETMAATAGVKLGGIESMRYGERAERPVPMTRSRMAAMAPPPVPVEAGALEMTADVEMTWVIE